MKRLLRAVSLMWLIAAGATCGEDEPEEGDACSEAGDIHCFSTEPGDYLLCVEGRWVEGSTECHCTGDGGEVCA